MRVGFESVRSAVLLRVAQGEQLSSINREGNE